MAAVEYVQQIEKIIADASSVLSVQPENLPSTVQRFFTEWKNQKKEIEHTSQRLVEMEIGNLTHEMVKDIQVVIRRIDLPVRDLATIASSVADQGGVALLASGSERAHVILMSGTDRINAGEIIGQVCVLLGGKGGGSKTLAQGGGPAVDQIDLALKVGKERILAGLYV
jgi:alanyl-tRNA synthetase